MMIKKLQWYAAMLLVAGGVSTGWARPTVSGIEAAQYIPGASGVRGTIATDSANKPHVAMTTAPSSAFSFHDLVNGVWVGQFYNSYALFNSSLFGSPHMEIDANDTAWISSTFWYPNMGIGITVRPHINSNPTAYPSFNVEDIWPGPATYDVANLALDPAAVGKCYFGSHRGVWEEYTYSTSGGHIYQSGNGTVADGAGGEKASFYISKAGSVAHVDGTRTAVKYHCTEYSFNNSLRAANGYGYYKWADWNVYHGMVYDHAYPSIVADAKNPNMAYMVAEYCRAAPYGIYLNVWKGTDNYGNGDCLFPITRLLCLDPDGRTGVGGRYDTQQAAANNGGTWVAWVRDNRAIMRYIPPTLTPSSTLNDCGPEVDVCAASVVSAICVDKNGDIHMVYYNNGVFYRKIKVSGDSAGSSSMYLPGDYDGDDLVDLCVYYPDSGQWNICFNDEGAFNRVFSVNWGWSEAQPVPGDYDGDGTTDVAVYHPDSGYWYVRPSSNVSSTNYNVFWGWSEAKPVPGDYDDDGITDCAVYYPETGAWIVRKSSDKQLLTRNYGYPGAKPVLGDFNGNGYDDFAVYVDENGTWGGVDPLTGAVIQELNNQPWGWSGAKPVPADYDGDGKTDRAVFSEGSWFVWLSKDAEGATWVW